MPSPLSGFTQPAASPISAQLRPGDPGHRAAHGQQRRRRRPHRAVDLPLVAAGVGVGLQQRLELHPGRTAGGGQRADADVHLTRGGAQREHPAVAGQQLALVAAQLQVRGDPLVVAAPGAHVAAGGHAVGGLPVPLAARAPGPAATARRRRRPAAGSATREPLVVGVLEDHGGHPVAVPLDVDRPGAVQRRRAGRRAPPRRMRASSSVRGTALPWSGNAAARPGQLPLPAEPGRAQPAVARVPAHPVAEARAGPARRWRGGSGRRRRSCPAGRRRRRRGRRRARPAPPTPRPPTRPDRRRRRGRRWRRGRRRRARRRVSQVAAAGQPNRGNAPAAAPSSARSSARQRLPPGAAAGGGHVVPAGRQRRGRAAPRARAGPRPAAPAAGPGRSSRTHEVEMVDGGLDGERGQQVGHRQHAPLGAAPGRSRSDPAGRHDDRGRGLGVARRDPGQAAVDAGRDPRAPQLLVVARLRRPPRRPVVDGGGVGRAGGRGVQGDQRPAGVARAGGSRGRPPSSRRSRSARSPPRPSATRGRRTGRRRRCRAG